MNKRLNQLSLSRWTDEQRGFDLRHLRRIPANVPRQPVIEHDEREDGSAVIAQVFRA